MAGTWATGMTSSWPTVRVASDMLLATMIFWVDTLYLEANPLTVLFALTVTVIPLAGGISSFSPTRIDAGFGRRLELAQ